jgi:hypothetical protein
MKLEVVVLSGMQPSCTLLRSTAEDVTNSSSVSDSQTQIANPYHLQLFCWLFLKLQEKPNTHLNVSKHTTPGLAISVAFTSPFMLTVQFSDYMLSSPVSEAKICIHKNINKHCLTTGEPFLQQLWFSILRKFPDMPQHLIRSPNRDGLCSEHKRIPRENITQVNHKKRHQN